MTGYNDGELEAIARGLRIPRDGIPISRDTLVKVRARLKMADDRLAYEIGSHIDAIRELLRVALDLLPTV